MGGDCFGEVDMEVLTSMWPENLGNEARKQFNIEKPGVDQDMLEEVTIIEEPTIVDFKRLLELTNYSEKGSSQLAYLVKQWEYKQANAVRLLNEELDNLSKQRQEVELKKLEIIEEHRFEEEKYAIDKRPVSILDGIYDIWEAVPRKRKDFAIQKKKIDIDAEYGTIKYWKQRAIQLDNLLEASIQREQILMDKLQESIKNLEKQTSPVEELSQILKRADHFLHFVLQNAPVVIGHQDNDLRYRFIYNHFPSLEEEDIIGKTDVEIFSGGGVKEIQEFKKEVLERGLPAKGEFTFETALFGEKTFLIYVEPVFTKAGDTIGVNYMGMDVTDQVIKREKMAKLREEIAVQRAKETELNKTIHITEETMRAKQMLATMSHEIRSPLTGVVSMAEVLANTRLDEEQRQLLDVMLSSGDLVLQLINDILDLSKVESGLMKLEATKFRPREVVKHVLQTAAASLQKELTLEGHIADDVPIEVIGDVLRIRQILTNLVSNAIKFTHEGKVGIDLHVVSEQSSGPCQEVTSDDNPSAAPDRICFQQSSHYQISEEGPFKKTCQTMPEGNTENNPQPHETTVWICCDVYDTGIGIPEKSLPTLFKKYMQVGADHARKYGGTGLGLAICKQLVELMGGHLTVTSQENCGSTFTFVLPCKVSPKRELSDDPDDISDMADTERLSGVNISEMSTGTFHFQPHFLLSSCGSNARNKKLPIDDSISNTFYKLNGPSGKSDMLPSHNCTIRAEAPPGDVCSVADASVASPRLVDSRLQGAEPYNQTVIRQSEKLQDEATGLVMNRYHSSSADSQNCIRKCTEVANISYEIGNSTSGLTSLDHEKNNNFQSTINSMMLSENKLKPKILLVEDNKINIMVTQSMMKQLGHTINVVNNGMEAIQAVQQCRYDLILMDVCMPIMDGLKATRLIRSFEENGNWSAALEAGVDLPDLSGVSSTGAYGNRIPIIAMTANALAESAAECLANGMDSFVSKPVTFQNLKQCLEQYLSC
ncbi:Histidine kinase 5 [Acorus gramineus]|uniref:histidine kinase n=1 Tax=Acorus gramineus TaxID=55184 RepID=A0AAV9BHY9_ACOGR|nr:Histidine kinase 5 [Acorus gramineus]